MELIKACHLLISFVDLVNYLIGQAYSGREREKLLEHMHIQHWSKIKVAFWSMVYFQRIRTETCFNVKGIRHYCLLLPTHKPLMVKGTNRIGYEVQHNIHWIWLCNMPSWHIRPRDQVRVSSDPLTWVGQEYADFDNVVFVILLCSFDHLFVILRVSLILFADFIVVQVELQSQNLNHPQFLI